MLIDIVVVDERLAGVMGEQVFGKIEDDFLRMESGFQRFERCGALLPPGGEVGVHAGDEGGELRMLINRGLN